MWIDSLANIIDDVATTITESWKDYRNRDAYARADRLERGIESDVTKGWTREDEIIALRNGSFEEKNVHVQALVQDKIWADRLEKNDCDVVVPEGYTRAEAIKALRSGEYYYRDNSNNTRKRDYQYD